MAGCTQGACSPINAMNVTGPIWVMLAVALAGCATTKKLHEPDLVRSTVAHKNLGVLALAFSAEATDLQVEQAPVTKLKASWNEARELGKILPAKSSE
jgi:hypothetical protein